MEFPRPALAFLLDSSDLTQSQNPAKAIRHIAEADYGFQTVEFDVNRFAYSEANLHDPYVELQRRGRPRAIVTTLTENGALAPAFRAEAERLRVASGDEIPVFAVNASHDENTTVSLGPEMTGAHVAHPEIYTQLADAAAVPTEPLPVHTLDRQFDLDVQKMRHMKLSAMRELQAQMDTIDTEDSDVRLNKCFGYAIDGTTLASDWVRVEFNHAYAMANLKDTLEIADRTRTRLTGTDSPPREPRLLNLFFGFQWNNVGGLQFPVVELFTSHLITPDYSEEVIQKVGNHLLSEKKVIPVSDGITLIDGSYKHPVKKATPWRILRRERK